MPAKAQKQVNDLCYAVIDTNVLVSALLSENDRSATVEVVERIFRGEIVPVYSLYIENEYKEVLSRKKFGFPSESVSILLSAIEKYGLYVEAAATGIILPDMKDVPFYEVVLEMRDESAYLVTGNIKHFPKEPFIVTARQLINILDGKGPKNI